MLSLLNRDDVQTRFAEFWNDYRTNSTTNATLGGYAVDAFGKALSRVKNDVDLALHLGKVPEDEIENAELFSDQMSVLCRYFRQLHWEDESE